MLKGPGSSHPFFFPPHLLHCSPLAFLGLRTRFTIMCQKKIMLRWNDASLDGGNELNHPRPADYYATPLSLPGNLVHLPPHRPQI